MYTPLKLERRSRNIITKPTKPIVFNPDSCNITLVPSHLATVTSYPFTCCHLVLSSSEKSASSYLLRLLAEYLYPYSQAF